MLAAATPAAPASDVAGDDPGPEWPLSTRLSYLLTGYFRGPLNGDVKIAQEDGKYTRSQVAEFFSPTDTIVLTGFPSVYDGDDAVAGDKITVYRTTGVVEVTATNAAGSEPRAGYKNKRGQTKPTLNKEDEELIP